MQTVLIKGKKEEKKNKTNKPTKREANKRPFIQNCVQKSFKHKLINKRGKNKDEKDCLYSIKFNAVYHFMHNKIKKDSSHILKLKLQKKYFLTFRKQMKETVS